MIKEQNPEEKKNKKTRAFLKNHPIFVLQNIETNVVYNMMVFACFPSTIFQLSMRKSYEKE